MSGRGVSDVREMWSWMARSHAKGQTDDTEGRPKRGSSFERNARARCKPTGNTGTATVTDTSSASNIPSGNTSSAHHTPHLPPAAYTISFPSGHYSTNVNAPWSSHSTNVKLKYSTRWLTRALPAMLPRHASVQREKIGRRGHRKAE